MSNHESNRQPDSGRNAESTLQSAARQLGRTAETNGGTQAGQRRILRGRQERDLEIWAKEVGCWLIASDALRGFIFPISRLTGFAGYRDFPQGTGVLFPSIGISIKWPFSMPIRPISCAIRMESSCPSTQSCFEPMRNSARLLKSCSDFPQMVAFCIMANKTGILRHCYNRTTIFQCGNQIR